MKPWRAWLIFLVCLGALTAAMGFTTYVLLRIDQERVEAAQTAAEQDAVRDALRRMDAEMANLVADEAARPYFEYYPFYPADGAYTRMFRPIEAGEVIVPSPLLAYESPLIRLHFEIKPDGMFTSPQAPAGNMRDLAESRYLKPEQVETRANQLETVKAALDAVALRKALPRRKPGDSKVTPEMVFADSSWAVQNVRNQSEYNSRAENTKRTAERKKDDAIQRQNMQQGLPLDGTASTIVEHPTTAFWRGGELYLARLVTIENADHVQCCLLKWPGIQKALAESAREILPEATFTPAEGADTALEHRLASLPVQIVPGKVNAQAPDTASPVRFVLWIAWGAVLVAAVAVGLVLRSTVSLSERRADFVSAVTHELRTPLTTLRMYAELLSTGRVKDESARGEYLDTMHAESVRLSHLVENVLSYARLERGRGSDRNQAARAGEIIDRARGALIERARQARMEMDIAVAPDAADATIRVDPAAVERILFNLVDNACKYAGAATDKRLELSVVRKGGVLILRVRDFGPGVDPETASRLFKPFRKSAQAAANSAPGVGLGLSLCRGLARAMGGDLRHVAQVTPGACFELELPVV